MDMLHNLHRKVGAYKEILENTLRYRAAWTNELASVVESQLRLMTEQVGLPCKIEKRGLENLEAIVLSLGSTSSGLLEEVTDDLTRPLIKNNGALIYQQLFNGKVLVMMQLPYIEKYGQPVQPQQIAIYRPEEIKEPTLLRHLETFIVEVTRWEDFDDDRHEPDPNHGIGFKVNFGREEG
jgi:hypothetical protein